MSNSRHTANTQTQAVPFIRKVLDRGFITLSIVSCALVLFGTLGGVQYQDGHGWIYFGALLGAATVPVIWSVLSLLSKRAVSNAISQGFARVLVLPFAVSLLTSLVGVIAVLLPPVAAQIARTRELTPGGGSVFSEVQHSPSYAVVLLAGLGGGIVAMLVGLMLMVCVFLPIVTFQRPTAFASELGLDISQAHVKRNALAGKAFSVLIILAFLIPILIIFGKANAYSNSLGEAFVEVWWIFREPQYYLGDLAWILGVLLIPVAVALLIVVKLNQKAASKAP